jgi:DNA modification methylase
VTVRILQGDCRDVLKTLPDESVHCVVTSPPYWGLRDYGVDGQIGLEQSPKEYVEKMAEVFSAVRRVLRSDGTLWLNLGDSYSAPNGRSGGGTYGRGPNSVMKQMHGAQEIGVVRGFDDIPAKNLIGIPWRVAFALQDQGWILRSKITWCKPNGMPESVTDRPTSSTEDLFLLSKSERYHYAAEAVRMPPAEASIARWAQYVEGQEGSQRANGGAKTNGPMKAVGGPRRTDKQRGHSRKHAGFNDRWDAMEKSEQQKNGSNLRNWWVIPTEGYEEAHFAVMPSALARICILAGCPAGGTVLDPFGGAGTTALVADQHGRDAISIELNPEYSAMQKRRIQDDSPLFAEVQ